MIMHSLHIIAKAPTATSLADLLAVIDESDVLIFIFTVFIVKTVMMMRRRRR